MLGQPEGRGFELKVANWDCAEACARELGEDVDVICCWARVRLGAARRMAELLIFYFLLTQQHPPMF